MGSGLFINIESFGQLLKRICILVISIIFILIYFIGLQVLTTYFVINNRTSDTFLITNTLINKIIYTLAPGFFILLIILYFVILKFYKAESTYIIEYGSINEIRSPRRIGSLRYNCIFLSLFLIIAFSFIYSIENYYELSRNKIVRHNIFPSKTVNYGYDEVDSCIVKAKNRGKYGGDLYYNVNLKDGNSFNAASSLYSEGSYAGAINVLDQIIKQNNIEKNIDRNHFYLLIDNKTEDEVKIYEKLFSK